MTSIINNKKNILSWISKILLVIAMIFCVQMSLEAVFADTKKTPNSNLITESSMADYLAYSSTLWSEDRTIKNEYVVKRDGNFISQKNTRIETFEPNGKIIDSRTTEKNFSIKDDGIHILEAGTKKDLGIEYPVSVPNNGKQIKLGEWEYAWTKQAVFDGVDIGPCVGRKNKSVPGVIEFQLYCKGHGLVAHRVGDIYRQIDIKRKK